MTEHSPRSTGASAHGRHEAEEPPETFADELRDAVAPRTVLLVVGVAVLCIGFVLSYVGAFHAPRPHRLPVAVAAPASVSPRLVAGLDGLDGRPLDASAVADEAAGLRRLRRADTAAVLVVDPSGTTDRLLVATGGGASLATVVERVVTRVEASQGRSVRVEDAVPSQPGDPQGSSVFYLVVGAVLAGYLLAAVLGMARGARPATFRRTLWRLAAAVPYALVVGLGTAVVAGPVLGAVTGHLLAVWLVASLLTYTAAAVTLAFQVLFGVVGIAATILVFVIVGNPSAGGAYPYRLLPAFWRTVGPALPNGAGVDALRRLVYFDGAGVAARVLVVVVWAVAGTALAVLAGALRRRAASRPRAVS